MDSVHLKVVSHSIDGMLGSSVEMELSGAILSWASKNCSILGVEEADFAFRVTQLWVFDLNLRCISNPLDRHSYWERGFHLVVIHFVEVVIHEIVP